MPLTVSHRRAQRALERQLAYQQAKAGALRGREAVVSASMLESAQRVWRHINHVAPVPPDPAVLEVGCGAHGLIFGIPGLRSVGIDPLAVSYASLFPWQERARTIAAFGEQLPFRTASFDVVLCDNVIDHAEGPDQILWEIVRVLKPGGVLYFTVNVHHPIYDMSSRLHGAWNAIGLRFEITPFADHTVHLTSRAAAEMLARLPLRILERSNDIGAALDRTKASRSRHAGDLIKRVFFKNAPYEVIAVRKDSESG
jgi:SAM-dependent methyltransferase